MKNTTNINGGKATENVAYSEVNINIRKSRNSIIHHINDSGLKKSAIAKGLNITLAALRLKLLGESDFKLTEIYLLSGILNKPVKELLDL